MKTDDLWLSGIKTGLIHFGYVVVAFFLIIFIGCAPGLYLKQDARTDEIAVCLEYGDFVPDSIRSAFDSVTVKFIADFNTQGQAFKLISCQNDNSRTLYLDVFRIQVTDPGKQAGGVFVTTLGLITPIVMVAAGSPFYVAFAYLPRSFVSVKMKLSEDIAENGKSKVRPIVSGSGKYFGSYEEQKRLLLDGYYNRLQLEMSSIATGRR